MDVCKAFIQIPKISYTGINLQTKRPISYGKPTKPSEPVIKLV